MEAATLNLPRVRPGDRQNLRRPTLQAAAAWLCGLVFLTAALAAAEGALGFWLISGVLRQSATVTAMVGLGVLAGVLIAETRRDDPRPCACILPASTAAGRGRIAGLWLGVARNVLLAGVCASALVVRRAAPHAGGAPAKVVPTVRTNDRRAFSLVELLVAVGIITILFGLVLPVVLRVRENGRRTACQSNLREIGHAFAAYQSHYGLVPRWARFGDRDPIWLDGIPTFLGLKSGFDWPELRSLKVLHCPSFPLAGVPTSYNLNVFAFETQPEWKPSPPVRLSQVTRSSEVYWVLESSQSFGPSAYGPFDGVFFEPHHIVSNPQNLNQRTALARHRRSSNVLFADGHVEEVRSGWFHFDRLDDGIRQRRWTD